MALVDTTWYTNFGDGSTTGYYAVTKWATGATIAAGALRRQNTTPTVGNERVFVCIIAGTTNATTEPTWVLTRGAKTTDNTITWMEVTGQAALNGDLANTATWAQVKAATPAVLGQIIKRSNNASYQICTTAGAMSASEPAFSDTAGVTTTDTTAVWTSLGAVSNFTGGQAPHARLANALASGWFISGNTVYIGDNHAETQATSIGISGSSVLMARILCHNHSGSYPPTPGNLTTGATITTTGNTLINITLQGSFYFYGLIFSGGTTGSNSGISLAPTAVGQANNWYFFDSCSLQIGSAGAGCAVQFTGASAGSWAVVILNNTTFRFLATSQYVFMQNCQFTWCNTGQVLASGSSVPAVLFQTGSNLNIATITLEALDLSQLTGSLYSNVIASSIGSLTIKDCKLNASATITQPINTGMTVQLSHSDSAAAAFRSTRSTYEAVESTETSIVRSGGYVDPTGQVQSRKIVTSTNAQWLRPYKSQPLSVWNSAVGSSKTVTVYGTVNAGALPNNDDLWMELSYLGSGSSPLGTTVTTGKAQVWSANAAGASDGSSWNGVAFATFTESSLVNAALTNGNLTMTHTTAASNSGGNSSSFVTTGKFYFEITIGTSFATGTDLVGAITTAASSLADMNSNINCVSLSKAGSPVSNGIVQAAVIGAWSVGDVIGFAFDLTSRLVWIRRNNGTWNNAGTANPVTGLGGYALYATVGYAPVIFFSSSTASGSTHTLNCGQSAFANAAPSGYSGWPGVWSPFKLTTTITPQLPGYIVPVIKAAKASTTFYIDPAVTVT